MFAARYFDRRYFAARYWPKVGGSLVYGPLWITGGTIYCPQVRLAVVYCPDPVAGTVAPAGRVAAGAVLPE